MGCPTECILGQNLTFTVQTYDGTGAPADATGSVSYSVYEDETATAILTGTMAKLASKTGFYSEQIATTAANGFEQYKTYTIRITATVSSVSVAKAYGVLCIGAKDVVSATTGALTTTANFKTYLGKTDSDDDTFIGTLIARATSAIEVYCDRILLEDTFRERYDGDGTSELLLRQYPVTDIDLLSTGFQDVLRITNTSSDAYNASVKVLLNDADLSVSETMTLTISGGTNDGSDDLTLSSYTVTTLATAINALGKGWSATVNVSDWGVWNATEILPTGALQCLDNLCYVQTPYEAQGEYEIVGITQSPYRNNYGMVYLPIGFAKGKQNVVVRYTAGYGVTPADLEQICIDLVKVYWDGRLNDASVKAEKLGDHAITFATNSRDIPVSIAKRLSKYKRFSV